MTELTLIPSSELKQLKDAICELREMIKGATIQPRSEWLTMEQVCAELGCSSSTVRRKASLGEIIATGEGKSRRYKLRRDQSSS